MLQQQACLPQLRQLGQWQGGGTRGKQKKK